MYSKKEVTMHETKLQAETYSTGRFTMFNQFFTPSTLLLLLGTAVPCFAQQLPNPDWLITPVHTPVTCEEHNTDHTLVFSNGLVRLTFTTLPDAALIGYDNLINGKSILRAVTPLATVELNQHVWNIGGLLGQLDRAFLRPSWAAEMQQDPGACHFTGYTISDPIERLTWKHTRPADDLPWPAPGKVLTLHFLPPQNTPQTWAVDVHYRLYTGLPLVCKWISIYNKSNQPVLVNTFTSELLAAVEGESDVNDAEQWRTPNITVTTDYSFGGSSLETANRCARWLPDPEYATQVNYNLKTPCLLTVKPPLGPDTNIPPQGTMNSFRTWELVHDSSDRERKGLEIRRMYRTIAPWVTENPLMLHLTSTDPQTVHTAIQQSAAVGFEMVIFSFGSKLNMEDCSAENIEKFKQYAQFAHSLGLQIGGYSLLASRHIDDQNDVINPKTGKPGGAIFGYSPCLCSKWGEEYFHHVKTFLSETGFDLLENDGSYPGDVCASTTHPGHHGLLDSQWKQFAVIAHFYQWCRARGIYLNVPDWYFLTGSNKSSMGYRETNWSLPRELQHLHARQNMYDGTWEKTPSMGWMFVPLVQYHGGGAAATIEPLQEHIQDYKEHLMDNFCYGVQACYRGPRLYDAPATKAMVQQCVRFFKKHRAILQSDIIHLRRPDGRDWDGILHVNPALSECGMAVFFNPLDHEIQRTIRVPLYYTGLTRSALVSCEGKRSRRYTLDRQYCITLNVSIPAHSQTWFSIRKGI